MMPLLVSGIFLSKSNKNARLRRCFVSIVAKVSVWIIFKA
jgi:hypothetical protein